MRVVDWIKVIWRDNKDATFLTKRVAVAVFGIPTLISSIENFGFPSLKDTFALSQFLPIPLYGWVIILLLSMLFFSFESGFRTWSKVADRLKAVEETSPKLRIDYRENDSRYLTQEFTKEHLSEGFVYSGHIHLFNDTESCETVKNVRVFIKDIIPFQNDEKKFKVVRRHFLDSAYSINAGLHQPILLFTFFDAPPFRDECKLEVPCHGMKDHVGNEFLMKIVASGDGVKEPARMEIRFGFQDETFFMRQES